MTEILTESFCERCGTRYTFESSAPRLSRLGRVKTLSKGVKNFVMSDEASFSEAMADARGEEELATTTHQLDAFHKTFNFCLTCRQYTCGDCWNVTDGRCLTCAPMDGAELAFSAPAASMAGAAAATNGHAAPPPANDLWPEADLSQDRLARALGDQPTYAEEAAPDEVASQLEVDAAAQAFDTPEPVGAEAALPDEAPITVDEAWRAAAAAAALAQGAESQDAVAFDDAVDDPGAGVETLAVAEAVAEAADLGAVELNADFDAQAAAAEHDATAEAAMDSAFDFDLGVDGVEGVAPGQSLEDAIAAYEARVAANDLGADAPSVEPEVLLAGAAALEAAGADAPLEAEPALFEPEPEPEPVAAFEPEPEPVAAFEPEPEPVVEDLWADLDRTVAEATYVAAASDFDDEPIVADVAQVVEASEPESVEAFEAAEVDAEAAAGRDEHELALAAFAAAALAAEPRDEEPVFEPAAVAFEPEPVVVVELEPEPVAAVEPAPAPEPVVAVEPAPEPVAAVEPEPEPVAAVEPEPEPVAAVEPEPEPVAAEAEPASRVDVVPQPTWPTTDAPQPTTIPVPDPTPAPTPAPAKAPWLMVAPAEEAARGEPQWPAAPSWRAGSSNTDAPTTLAGRTLLPQPDASALWAASAREVLSAPPVDLQAASPTPQPCVQCGLSLSSSARFCRRCGARQG